MDINAACPVKKAVRKKAGAYLVKHPEKLYEMVHMMASALPVPVTVKLRSGYAEKDPEAISAVAKNCEKNGASAIFIHGRTREQGYAGEVDYESIRAVKDSVKIPVIGSGNIFTPESARQMMDETSCDGVLVARGALGNPWIFKDIQGYLKNKKAPKERSISVKARALKEHLDYMDRYNDMPPGHKMGLMGRVAVWYLKGFPNAASIRNMVFKSKTYGELIDLINSVRRG